MQPSAPWRVVAAVAVGLVATLVPATTPAGAAPDPDGCFVMEAHQIFLDRDATAGEISAWTARFDAGEPRYLLPYQLANGDEWLTVEVTKLYLQALDRAPDAAGLAFWVGELRRGVLVNRIASQIYGSGEFYALAGGTDEGFVTELYDRILHRQPDQAGLEHWLAQIPRQGRGRVAALFFASGESRRDRVTRLYQQILGRAPDASGLAYWVEQLATVNDVRLAVQLASGGELYDRAQQGCVLPPPDVVTFTGHGWGHGRGMGQYGALGYALDHGWSATQILDHFYGGTVAETLPSSATQRVFLTASQGKDLVVTQTDAVLRVDGHGADVAAVRVQRTGTATFAVSVSATVGCSGPWTSVGTRSASEVLVQSRLAQGDDRDRLLQHCRTDGRRFYRGALRAVDAPSRGIVTVNEVDTEAMLRSVVPAEMPAYWGDLDGGKGAAALRAQAVAARSYALSPDNRWGGWATTCDSTQCQAYTGAGSQGSGAFSPSEYGPTDVAVLATARVVRRIPGAGIARTEFSSSTGGWTAGGTFPAVVDEGDDTSRNPYHDWTETVTATELTSALGGSGAFLGFDQWQRDGNGDLGGRVLSVRARFSGGDRTLTGDQVRVALGLRSNWFTA